MKMGDEEENEKSREMGANSSSSAAAAALSGGGGFCYLDNTGSTIQPQHLLQGQGQGGGGFVAAASQSEMFSLSSGIHMMTNNTLDSHTSTTNNYNLMLAPHSSSSSAGPWHQDHHHHHHHHTRLIVDDESCNFRCVFPCEGNERPSQGLSLSLSSTNPSTIGLQSFELRQTTTHHHHQMLQQDQGYDLMNPPNNYQGHHNYFSLRNSKFLLPAQDLLNEFCSLGQQSEVVKNQHKNKKWEEDQDNNGESSGGSSKKHPLSSLEFLELQKRKTKLLAMLEEVERRYKNYCNQMRAVASSFEAVAGKGAARVYSALALKAMSRHFRCLKDGIADQMERTRKAMGEREESPVAPGTTRGETPRLRVIDQALRQQRAFQQMTIMETHPWRPQRGLPERSVSLLRAWLFEHFLHPYPSDVDKHILARQTGLSRSQVSNWFINARVRLWKPMVEEMYLEEAKENGTNMASSEGGTNTDLPPDSSRSHDHKPSQARLLRIDSECVSSIINNSDHQDDPTNKTTKTFHNMNPSSHDDQQFLGRVAADAFGTVEIDFSSYDHHHHSTAGMVSYNNGGGAVSLTLGLQQHAGGNAVSLAFPPAAATQGSMFYSREQIVEECQPVVHQYSLLDGEGQSMPYRNLMGTQLLHDLAN